MSGGRRDQDDKPAGFDDVYDVKTVAEDLSESDEITAERPAVPTAPQAPRPATHRIFVTGARVRPLDDDDDDGPTLAPPQPAAPAAPAAAEQPFEDMPPTKLSSSNGPAARKAADPTVARPSRGGAASVRLVDEASPPRRAPIDPADIGWQLAPGDVVGTRYTIRERLARGGMAEVYVAEQEGFAGFSKKVVIKRILPEFVQDKLFIEHFVREANLASQLTHDHIAQVYDLGKDRGGYYLAMEYIPGITLSELAHRAWEQGRSFPVELVLLAIADAAEGLVYGWRTPGSDGKPMRLVHRDISPDNLMVNAHGTTKVLDYGVAKAADSADLTSAGEIKGKISYVPPELILEHKRDHRSDLYALGVTGYWLCTGARPFAAQNPTALIHSILRDQPPTPRSLNPQLPPVVDQLMMRLLDKKPDQRFSDGQALSEHIHGLLGAVRRASLGRFVSDVMNEVKPRAVPTVDPPAAVVTIGLAGGSSETPTGEWETP